MKKLLSNVVCALSICAVTGCLSLDGKSPVPERQACGLFLSLENAWQKCAANSLSCHSALGLSKFDGGCRGWCEKLRKSGHELQWIYKLGDWYVLECRRVKGGEEEYFKLGRASAGGRVVCEEFDLDRGFRLNVAAYASPLRFAPIVKDSAIGFTKMWDSRTDRIVGVPSGFHGLIQGGAGVFLLRSDIDGDYYKWNASKGSLPEKWNYAFPSGSNPRSSFFVARSKRTDRSYAFAVGLEPIPNSEGALSISPCGAYKGRQYFGVSKVGVTGCEYYAWPETGRDEPLSNGTESFGGCPIVVRNGSMVVVSPEGVVDVTVAKSCY